MRPKLLVTGFGPFPRVPRNPSEVVARRVAGSPRLRRVLGERPRLLIMRTAYAAIGAELDAALAEQPRAVLMFGVATRAKRIRVETRAVNRASRLFPDASGTVSKRLTLEGDGPAARRSAAAAARLALVLARSGARISRDAGRYLCNASYFRVLREGCPAVFIHIPQVTGPIRGTRRRHGLDDGIAAYVEAALALTTLSPPSLRAQRSNPGNLDAYRGSGSLDCFAFGSQ